MGIPIYSVTTRARRAVVMAWLLLGLGLLVTRAVDLQVVQKEFLQSQGDARALRKVPLAAHRGMLMDRFGEPLAISTPVASIWADPSELAKAGDRWPELAQVLGMHPQRLAAKVEARKDKSFAYLKRQVSPAVAQRVKALGIPGVAVQREYKRYYPAGEVMGQVLGFTGRDDRGQEGLERAYDEYLAGIPGAQRVVKDRRGRIVEALEVVREPQPGRDLRLSLDRRIQYIAYRALQDAVRRHRAKGGSLVLLDVNSGEVLALVNQPVFNPNGSDRKPEHYRNRALTDIFEPGSTIKPFTILGALQTGRFHPDTVVDTRPGEFKVGRKVIKDTHDYGIIDVARVIQKSSNVGASMIALTLEPKQMWGVLSAAGFGAQSGTGYPGESRGILPDYHAWRRIEHATLSYGYGLSVSTMQLARAYAVLAADGKRRPVSFMRTEQAPEGSQVWDPELVAEVRDMLEQVVLPGGTGTRARVPGYRVAGKTGTVRKAEDGSYRKNAYLSVFAGFAPATRPRLAMAVMIDEPRGKQYYGGLVAAPVFSEVMAGALRLLDVAPDDPAALGRLVLNFEF